MESFSNDKTNPLNCVDMHYTITYPEAIQYGGKENWGKATIRQTGVYHMQMTDQDYDLWIFLHPSKNPPLQKHIEETLLAERPLGVSQPSMQFSHSFALACYLDNWRWYLKALNKELEALVRCQLYLSFTLLIFLERYGSYIRYS
jgi:hypothetical protein